VARPRKRERSRIWVGPDPVYDRDVSTRHAACSCEQLRLTVGGDPVRASCHCLACQRRTGSVFGAQARFDTEQVMAEGASRQYVCVSDEGRRSATFHFCPDCGATVFSTTEAMRRLPDDIERMN